SVVVTALGGDIEVATGWSQAVNGTSLREAGAEAAACMKTVERRASRVLLLLSDGLSGDQAEVVRGAYNVVGPAVPLVGGCAGDDLKMERTYQFHDGRVVTAAVVTAALSSDGAFGIGVRHGWRKLSDAAVVTANDGHRVLALDDRPALDVYLERSGAPAEAHTDPAAFSAFALTHPLALGSRSGEEQMRFISGADFEARSLECVAEVPAVGLVWVSEGDDESVL